MLPRIHRLLITALFLSIIPFFVAAEGDLSLDGEMDPAQVASAEAALRERPDDVALRVQLLEAYSLEAYRDRDQQRAAIPHALWLIRNKPQHEWLRHLSSMLSILPQMQPELWAQIDEAFHHELAAQPESAALHGHFGCFLRYGEPDASVRHLREAIRLDPQDRTWIQELADVLAQNMAQARDERRRELAAEVEPLYVQAEALGLDPMTIFYGLGGRAWAAYEAHDLVLARSLAQRLLRLAPEHPEDWYHGNAIHEGHGVLGACAYTEGDMEAAAKELVASARSKGSPQLNSFGPDFSLAQALLQAGQTDAVIAYLRGVGDFWEMDRGAIPRWIALIEGGGRPQLGMQSYHLRPSNPPHVP